MEDIVPTIEGNLSAPPTSVSNTVNIDDIIMNSWNME